LISHEYESIGPDLDTPASRLLDHRADRPMVTRSEDQAVIVSFVIPAINC
jgi:hypothetical protein